MQDFTITFTFAGTEYKRALKAQNAESAERTLKRRYPPSIRILSVL